jgi:Uma2 family endonuclease
MAAAKKPATYADIEALPEHLVGEIIDGELIVSPRPRPAHARVEAGISADLVGPFDRGRGGPGGWWILPEPELHLERHVLVPDVAGWRRDRLPTLPDAASIALAPDWVCEVLSPSTAKIDRTRKIGVYGEQGVEHLWLVDPLSRVLEVYRRSGRTWLIAGMYADDARARIEPFAAVELDLSNWWLPRPPGVAAEAPIVWNPSALPDPSSRAARGS